MAWLGPGAAAGGPAEPPSAPLGAVGPGDTAGAGTSVAAPAASATVATAGNRHLGPSRPAAALLWLRNAATTTGDGASTVTETGVPCPALRLAPASFATAPAADNNGDASPVATAAATLPTVAVIVGVRTITRRGAPCASGGLPVRGSARAAMAATTAAAAAIAAGDATSVVEPRAAGDEVMCSFDGGWAAASTIGEVRVLASPSVVVVVAVVAAVAVPLSSPASLPSMAVSACAVVQLRLLLAVPPTEASDAATAT